MLQLPTKTMKSRRVPNLTRVVTLLFLGALFLYGASVMAPWSVQPKVQAQTVRVVQSVCVTGTTPTSTDNDFTRINNVITTLQPGDIVELEGFFDWRETNAQNSWLATPRLGLGIPSGVNNVTIRPRNNIIGNATIQGPGDVATANLEGVFVFPFDPAPDPSVSQTGDNQNWTITNLRILDFDVAIGMYQGNRPQPFTGTQVLTNYIRLARDLNGTVAPADPSGNIAVHFSRGLGQRFAGNILDFPGDGVSNPPFSFSSHSGFQSNTAAIINQDYDGLIIENNSLRVVNSPSANPDVILGIWENSQQAANTITIRNNCFQNLGAANNPPTNLQRAFRCTSSSSATATVLYRNNTVLGANTAFQFIGRAVAVPSQPVLMESNLIDGAYNGFILNTGPGESFSSPQTANNVRFTNNQIRGFSASAFGGIGIRARYGSVATIIDTPLTGDGIIGGNTISQFDTGIEAGGPDNSGNIPTPTTVTVKRSRITGNQIGILVGGAVTTLGASTADGNCFIGNNGFGLRYLNTGSVTTVGDFWGAATGPNTPGADRTDGIASPPVFAASCTAPTTNVSNASGCSLVVPPALRCATSFSLTKTANPPAVEVGQNTTFTITITNNGPDAATGVQVSDPMPPGTAFVSATPSQGTYTAGTGLWNVGTILVGNSATLQITVTVTQVGTITNVASIVGSNPPVSGGIVATVVVAGLPPGGALQFNVLHVADTANNRVQVYDGVQWALEPGTNGIPGTGPGQFITPEAVTATNTGRIWVADTGNARIQWYNGSVWSNFVNPGLVNAPRGVAVDPLGQFLYVSDSGNHRVLRYNATAPNSTPSIIATQGDGPGQVRSPMGLAVDLNNNLYIASSGNSRILRVSNASTAGMNAGVVVAGPGGGINPVGQVMAPEGVACDASGNLYIADTQNNRILSLPGGPGGVPTGGAPATVLMARGISLGQVTAPEGITITFFTIGTRAGFSSVIVSDTFNNRIQGRPLAGGSWSLVAGPGTQTGARGNQIGQFTSPSKIR